MAKSTVPRTKTAKGSSRTLARLPTSIPPLYQRSESIPRKNTSHPADAPSESVVAVKPFPRFWLSPSISSPSSSKTIVSLQDLVGSKHGRRARPSFGFGLSSSELSPSRYKLPLIQTEAFGFALRPIVVRTSPSSPVAPATPQPTIQGSCCSRFLFSTNAGGGFFLLVPVLGYSTTSPTFRRGS